MKVKFNLELFNQTIPIEVNVPDDYVKEFMEDYGDDIKIAVNELINDELENIMIKTWEPVKVKNKHPKNKLIKGIKS